MITDNILFIGCGKMGAALLGGILPNVKSKNQILVVDPNANNLDVKTVDKIDKIGSFTPDIVILAIKPQIAEEVLPQIAKNISDDAIIISILAGKKVGFFKNYFPEKQVIVRTMPNLPALVSNGATIIYSDNINAKDKNRINIIFNFVGRSFWIDDEDKLDAVTAISGSGPAYVFYFMQLMLEAALDLGLEQKMAESLVLSTFKGSALLAEESDKNTKELKEQVISPGGTTKAAIDVFESNNRLANLVKKAVNAAHKRSVELGS